MTRLPRCAGLGLRAAFLCALTLGACTDATLFSPPVFEQDAPDNKLSMTGGFCAEGAKDLAAYFKLMLIIDRSNSLNVTDPNNQRISAAQKLVLRFVEDPITLRLQDGVEIAIISFWGDVMVHTRDARGLAGYSRDTSQILFSIGQAAQTSSNTGYDKALAQAFLLLDSDMARLSDKARALSRYETIFLSDGMPFPDNCLGESNAPTAAVESVERIAALSVLHKVTHHFHTAFASTPLMFEQGNDVDNCQDSDPFEENFDGSIGEEVRALLEEMAKRGSGSFTQFNNGDSINFQGFEFAEARRIYALSNFVLSNINAIPDFEFVLPDSDGDGLHDEDEDMVGSNPNSRDTDDDGFNDALEWRLRLNGFDPLDSTDAVCDALGMIDTDGDGLRDCEEALTGTLRRSIDTDADGLVDSLEVSFGTNPNSANPLQDLQADADADGGLNADEVRWHTDPNRDDVAFRSRIAYSYQQKELPITTGQACYEFGVTNITLADTMTLPAWQTATGSKDPAGWNRIMLYFAQTPYDQPLSDPIYRVACVEARYVHERDLKIPASGRFAIPPTRPSGSWRPSPVLRPNNAICHASVNQDCGINTIWCSVAADGTCSCNRPPRTPQEAVNSPDGIPIGACPACANGQDDDNDGLTDFPFDPDCFDSMDTDESSQAGCFNGSDDDFDGLADWPKDPGCTSAYDNDEADPASPPECANGLDDDGDGGADFPSDPGCYAASDNTEAQSLLNPVPPCSDGLDNDGDGQVDMNDPGCFDPNDIDEGGPAVCFFCEPTTGFRPGQCDIGAGFCKPRSGRPPSGNCQNDSDCRGSICDTTSGVCKPCLRDRDCASGVCDTKRGWCLSPAYTPKTCASDAECFGTCDIGLGYCRVDPFFGCLTEKDCVPGDLCSPERKFCLTPVFDTLQCDEDTPCADGRCDPELGWCLPTEEPKQCYHDDLCPFGVCNTGGYCEQQTFVYPTDFDPAHDCLRAR